MPTLEMRNITKAFPGVKALDGVSFSVDAGEVHSIVGENGAGKSTLIKVLAGVYGADTFEGEILIAGEKRFFKNVADSEQAGIAVIYQELSLVNELTVGENIFLGKEPSRFGLIDSGELYRRSEGLLKEIDLNIDPQAKAGSLGIGRQQLVEIAKALSRDARILVLDEPTAALSEAEAETLFSILDGLRSRGVAIIYISHKLEEVLRLSDRITVLRDGQMVASFGKADAERNSLIKAMVGREVEDIFPTADHAPGDPVLEVVQLTVHSPDGSKRAVVDVSFQVRQGEVVGIAGLMGSGRTELLTAIFGAWTGKVSGTVKVDGTAATINSPSDAISHGIAFVTEDRQRYGLEPERSVSDNITLAALRSVSGRVFTDSRRETSAAAGMMENLRIKADSPATIAGTLSGGNQQKVVLGKWLLTSPRVLLLDEPTRGIDIGAKEEIYAEINKLAADGIAIVLVSSELPEVLGLSDRVIVLHNGRITAQYTRDEATPEMIMAAATGTL